MDARKREHLIEQLSAYVDDELTPAERRDVEAFLAEDAEGRSLVAELRATSAALHGLPRARASEDLLESMRSRMERQALLGEIEPAAQPELGARSFRFRWVAAAAVIALSFVSLYMVSPWSHPGRPPLRVVSADRKASKDKDVRSEPTAATVKEPAVGEEKRPAGSGEMGFFAKAQPAKPDEREMAKQKAPADRFKSQELKEADRFAMTPAAPARKGGGVFGGVAAGDLPAEQPVAVPQQGQVIAFVELSYSDRTSQKKAEQVLTDQYAFRRAVVVGRPARALNAEIAQAQSQVSGDALSLRAGDAVADEKAGRLTGDQDADGAAFPTIDGGLSVAGEGSSTVALERVVPDVDVAKAIQEVQSHYPSARVQIVSAQDRLGQAQYQTMPGVVDRSADSSRQSAAQRIISDKSAPMASVSQAQKAEVQSEGERSPRGGSKAASAPSGSVVDGVPAQHADSRVSEPAARSGSSSGREYKNRAEPALLPGSTSMPATANAEPQLEDIKLALKDAVSETLKAFSESKPAESFRGTTRPAASPASAASDQQSVILVYLRVASTTQPSAVALDERAAGSQPAATAPASQPP